MRKLLKDKMINLCIGDFCLTQLIYKLYNYGVIYNTGDMTSY